mgnify:CR=1 FL=1
MFYLMLRSAIRSRSQLKEVNHAKLFFNRETNTFKMNVDGIDKGMLVTREFEEMNDDPTTIKLADGIVEYLKITQPCPELTMEIDFLLKQTIVNATIKEGQTTKTLQFNV